MTVNKFLREVPEHLIAGVMSGDMQIYGSVIRSVSKGKIVGHLQQTNAFSNIFGLAGNGVTAAALGPVGILADIGGHAITAYQNHQMKAAVDLVQKLQLGSLALCVTGIGVSVASHVILSKKINRIESKITEFGEQLQQIEAKISQFEQRQIRGDFARLRTLSQQYDEAWLLGNKKQQWAEVARGTHELANHFELQARTALEAENMDKLAARPFYDACALASSIRVAARMAAGEDDAARLASQEAMQMLLKLGEFFDVVTMVTEQTDIYSLEKGIADWTEEFDSIRSEITAETDSVHDIQISALSLCENLDALNARGISAQKWLASARDEQDTPFIFLSSDR